MTEPTQAPTLRSFALTDIGRKRQMNQDAFLCDDNLGLYIVADGVGGQAGGEVASHEAIEAAFAMVKRDVLTMPDLRGELCEERAVAACRLLEGAVQGATYMVFALAELDQTNANMGTTMSALLVLGLYAVIAQVGDSRIYQCREGLTRQLTEDHTLVAWQVREGMITEQQAKRSPLRNVITRSVGNRDYVQVDVRVVDTQPGDRFLLCSDGLHGYFVPGEVEQLLVGAGEEVVTRAIALANHRGGRDNITAVVVDIEPAGPRATCV